MSAGLYVHLPFCRVHCTYCAFAISTDQALEDRYVAALLIEIEARGTGETVESIYFGGGTPSRTALPGLQRIADRIRSAFRIAADAEFSIEANPEDVTTDTLAAWRDLGVNRVSIGVQSFIDEELQPLGRVHGSQQASRAVETAAVSGVRTNLDLILGLPRQTTQSFSSTLEEAIRLGAGHISLYMLDLEEKSPLRVQVDRGWTRLPEDDLVAALYLQAIERLEKEGLHQYEISNFARTGDECRHNLRYWTRGDYHGFGMGAHSFVQGRRFANTRDIRKYIEAGSNTVDFSENLSELEVKRETIFLGLRQTTGLDCADLERLCGQEGTEWVDRGLREGWLQRLGGRVAFTPSGFLVSTDLIAQLF